MTSILETIGQALGKDEVRSISRQIGADERATANALDTSLPALIGALNRNASQGGGAQDIFNAVARDHDGSLLDHLGDFISHSQDGPGEGILGHLFGNRRPTVEAGLSRASGLDGGTMGKLLSILAPVVMGAIGKAQRSSHLDAGGLGRLLNDESRKVEQTNPQAMGSLSRLLDADNDGDVDLGDLTRHGFGLLSKLLH
ncbi:MAG: hypothetical protein C0617_09070 [Desulfuromonas sp.]|uniref:DUF937 domain-containing protein n=1 Tax=Desulfuromonas sp. TaxID=892 RepID=UPI000CB3090B|nr:DUF937 domain-containing protein [Desulfuromonas sp.]PLX84216.1 MAG: hypothetical protein C0617_09070 [Desulfuromonas sp.]